MNETTKIGFIGIGKMGSPMARRLADAGHPMTIFDMDEQATAPFAELPNVTISGTANDAVADADIAISMLPNGAIVRSVVEQVSDQLKPGSVWVDMSTSYPLETTALRDEIDPSVGLVDAPVSGGVWRAELGTLTLITGGDPNTIDHIEPVLSLMGDVVRTGPLGSGHAMKLLNNYLSASGLAAASEAILIGQRFGLDPDVMADVFNNSTGMNNATKVKLKQHINNQKFATGFTMGLMSKDLTLAKALARDMHVDAAGLVAAQRLFREGVDVLGGDADHSEIIKVLESSDDKTS